METPEFESLSKELPRTLEHVFASLIGSPLMMDGAYYEFGVFHGFSLFTAEKTTRPHRGPEFMFYGFDSFEGLPKSKVDREKNWFQGAYKVAQEVTERNLREHGADMERIVLTKGFFSQPLFAKFWETHKRTPAVILVDSDIYESCVEVLEFFGPKCVPGTIIIFDEYNSSPNGEKRALREFEERNPRFQKKLISKYAEGEVFEVVAASGVH